MGWLAIFGSDGRKKTARLAEVGLLARGTLVLECGPVQAASVLLDYAETRGWARALRLMLDPVVGLELTQQQGPRVTRLRLAGPLPCAEGLRVIYSWNAPQRCSRLAVETPGGALLARVEGRDPQPLPVDEIAGMAQAMGPQTDWLGVTSGAVPLGIGSTLSAGAMVPTPGGPVMAGDIVPGDLVQTVDHGAQPLRWCRRVERPAMGAWTPVRLRAPYYGAGHDLLVGPGTRLVMSGTEVDYLFAEDEVMARARHLVDGRAALFETRRPVVAQVALMFDRHEVLDIDGCRVETMYRGSEPGTGAHGAIARRELHAFEAVSLTAMREASRNPMAA